MTSNELELSTPHTVARADLRNPVTDSWTDVLEDVAILSGKLCRTEFVPKDLRGSIEKTAAVILTGRELNLPPMQALSSVYVVHGTPGLYAETMRGLILSAGHELTFPEMTGARCIVKGRRRTEQDWTTVSYTMAEAERSGDARQNQNYRTRPAEMLLARATTRLARMIFADVIHGLRSVEELQDLTDDEMPAPRVAVESVKVSRDQGRRSDTSGGGVPAGDAGEGPAGSPPAERPARRRAQLPARRRAAPAAEEPAQETPPTPVPGEQEPAGQPDQAEAPEPEKAAQDARERLKAKAKASDPDKINAGQRAAIMAQCSRIDVTDRDVRLGYLSEMVGRELGTANDLTRDEAHMVLGVLEKARDVKAFEAGIAAISDARAADGGDGA